MITKNDINNVEERIYEILSGYQIDKDDIDMIENEFKKLLKKASNSKLIASIDLLEMKLSDICNNDVSQYFEDFRKKIKGE